jgi:phage recombination protein Bet
MAQAALTIAPRYTKPPGFAGTVTAWRALCECYPAAENPEVVLAVVEYCTVRKLDPYKRPVHVVPMYNARLRRKVQVVMQGINEVEITAARTGQWAGMDLPVWGPMVKRTFRGEFENDDGTKKQTEVTLEFPAWCAVTVYRLVGGQPRAFTEQLFWEESYGRAGFRSEIPNQRWQQARRQMLHKCTKAATLRAAFPEEGFGYVAEEMEDRETDTGGITIDGVVDQGQDRSSNGAGIVDRRPDRREPTTGRGEPAGDPRDDPPPDDPRDAPVDPLQEPNGTRWLANLKRLTTEATTLGRIVELRGHARVHAAMDDRTGAPAMIREQITAMFKAAHERLAPTGDDPPPGDPSDPSNPVWDDPIEGLLREVEAMDAVTIAGLMTSAVWRGKVRELFPPDQERLDEAIAARKAALKGGSTP